MRDSRSHRLGTDTRYLKLYLGIHCRSTPWCYCYILVVQIILGLLFCCALPELNPAIVRSVNLAAWAVSHLTSLFLSSILAHLPPCCLVAASWALEEDLTLRANASTNHSAPSRAIAFASRLLRFEMGYVCIFVPWYDNCIFSNKSTSCCTCVSLQLEDAVGSFSMRAISRKRSAVCRMCILEPPLQRCGGQQECGRHLIQTAAMA